MPAEAPYAHHSFVQLTVEGSEKDLVALEEDFLQVFTVSIRRGTHNPDAADGYRLVLFVKVPPNIRSLFRPSGNTTAAISLEGLCWVELQGRYGPVSRTVSYLSHYKDLPANREHPTWSHEDVVQCRLAFVSRLRNKPEPSSERRGTDRKATIFERRDVRTYEHTLELPAWTRLQGR